MFFRYFKDCFSGYKKNQALERKDFENDFSYILKIKF